MDTGQLFRKLREHKKLSQQLVAEKIGWNVKEITRLELGGDNVTVGKLKIALKALEATATDLFQSNVPDRYQNERHQHWHEQLQEILDSDGNLELAISTSIESMHSTLMQEKAKLKRNGTRRRGVSPRSGPN